MPVLFPTVEAHEIKKGDKFVTQLNAWQALADAGSMIPMALRRTVENDYIAIRVMNVAIEEIDFIILRKTETVQVGREEKSEADKAYDAGQLAGMVLGRREVLEMIIQEGPQQAFGNGHVRLRIYQTIGAMLKAEGKI